MTEQSQLYETKEYRCLVYREKQTADLYLTLCGIEKCLPGYEFHTAERTGYHLHVILYGKGVLSVNGVTKALQFGQMFITKPGEETWYRADEKDPWGYCWMTFDGRNAGKYVDSAGFRVPVNWQDCHVDQGLFYQQVRQTLDLQGMTLCSNMRRLGGLLEYLALAIESNMRGAPENQQEPGMSADVYVDYAVNYIHTHYATAKVADIANYIGIHRSYLSTIFHQKMGVSPQEYMMQCRMSKAAQLLQQTTAPVGEISQTVGYDNPLTFSKIFKNYYGVSPRNYRNADTPAHD